MMTPEDDDFYQLLSNYLTPITVPVKLSMPLPVCFDHGKAAAMDGKTDAANPFLLNKEPEQYASWLKGFNAGRSTMARLGVAQEHGKDDSSDATS